MAFPDIFSEKISSDVIARINQLNKNTIGQWGKMTVSQMLAHCNVAYEMVYDDKHSKPGAFMKLILKWFVKDTVVGPKPYKRNGPTAPAFKIVDDKDFENEKQRLIGYIQKTQQLGRAEFEGKESNSFGKLTGDEWNVMFYKHLDHHLTQFGV